MSVWVTVLWVIVGGVLVVWGVSTETTWLKWFLIIAGAIGIVVNGIVLVRRLRDG